MERGPQTTPEVLAEAYIEYNRRQLIAILSEECRVWGEVLKVPACNRLHIEAEIKRLDEVRDPLDALIMRYRIDEPIDLTFVQELRDYLDSVDAHNDQFDTHVASDTEATNVQESLKSLIRRNASDGI